MTSHTASTTRLTSTRASIVTATLGLLAGSFLANGVPHIVFGLTGADHATPFGTTPGINLIWGLANLLIGIGLAAPAARRAYVPFTIGAAAGALGTAISLIILWS